MNELELSLLSISSQNPLLKELLKEFEEQYSLQVRVNQMNWETAWSDMMGGMGSRSKLPALAETGTTWVPDLARVDALSPIPSYVVGKLGGEKDYLPQLWKSCFSFSKPQIRAIPWISGSRVIYYRRDLLQKAGIDAERAFANPDAMLQTVIQLHESGIACPWITSNVTSLNSLHLISSWLWAGGGDFISEDGQNLLFAEPSGIESMAAFFEMGRYMGSKPQEYSYSQAIDLFWRGDAAITMDGTWRYDAQRDSASVDVLDNLGVALPPGPAFVGGSNLAVWMNGAESGAAWDLLQFLSEPKSLLTIFKLTGLAPAKLSLLNLHEVRSRPFGTVFNQAIETGRSLPNHCFSGMVEDMLQYAFGLVWADLLKYPYMDARDILAERLLPLKEPWMA